MYQACVSTLIIQIVPIFFIYAVNLVFLGSKSLRDKVIYLMISFAIGGLLGDVFFHTLPHMSSHYTHDHSHHHHHDHHDHAGHAHSHNPKEMCNNSIIMTGIIGFFILEKLVANCLGHSHSHDHSGADKKVDEQKKGSGKKGAKGKKHEEEDEEKLLRYRSYAVISLVGDFIHNFTDGLSIGVAYIASKDPF